GLFVLASGITILQVAANLLAAALGKPEYSHFRLTFSQTFNSLGTFIGPYLGAVLFLKGIETKQCEATTHAARLTSLAGIDRAYFWICGFIIALALLFIVFRRTVTEAAPPPSQEIARRGSGQGGRPLLGRRDGWPGDRIGAAGAGARRHPARGVHGRRVPDVSLRLFGRRGSRGRRRFVHRPVQFDHVPGDLHAHSRAV